MKLNRSSGILLHPTSLPGRFGIGDFGPQARKWIDFLVDAGCSLWQVLPLGPTGYGDSPYQCFSAFAGNPLLISPELLMEEGFLKEEDLVDIPGFPEDRVDFSNLIPWKLDLLDRAYLRFECSASADLRFELSDFRFSQGEWLEEYALFMAIKEAESGSPWTSWDEPLRMRIPEPLVAASLEYFNAVQRQVFRQFLFFRQWQGLHDYALKHGVCIIGDVPIFVSHDSADVWAHPELFYLDKAGQPKVVAGVPPDYFSPTGQRWGNPLYRWKVHKDTGYQWWLSRFHSTLNLVDYFRLDHFRGFCGYWKVPGKAKTAEKGRWAPGPGKDFFKKMFRSFGELPIIAEDLGVITPDVVELRKDFGLPGMKVLQFAFSGNPKDAFLPHNFPVDCVVYTGTHDNDTTQGWYESLPEAEKDFLHRYLNRKEGYISWDLIRAGWSSVAAFAIAPMQDFLNLGSEARFNFPGNPSGNWTWRISEAELNQELVDRIREMNFLYDRVGNYSSEDTLAGE